MPKDKNEFGVKEADLKQHLQSELEKIDNTQSNATSTKNKNKDIITNDEIYKDIQLKSAIDALKVLTVVGTNTTINMANK